MPRPLRTLDSRTRRNLRADAAIAIVAGVIGLVALTGCGSSQGHGGSGSSTPAASSGILTGTVTFSGPNGNALVRVFDPTGRMVGHRGVSSKHPNFRLVLASGQYDVLLRVVARPGQALARCVKASPHIQAHQTTHITLGQTCSGTH